MLRNVEIIPTNRFKVQVVALMLAVNRGTDLCGNACFVRKHLETMRQQKATRS